MSFVIYGVDTETTGVSTHKGHSPIEISLIRFASENSPEEQKTWFLQPASFENIEVAALKVNGHKLEDLKHQTEEGRKKYHKPSEVLVEIENWVTEDGLLGDQRYLVGHNVNFDANMLQYLWHTQESLDSYPFGRRVLDTMMIEFFLDWSADKVAPGYRLQDLTKKYGVTNSKAHSADADTRAMKEVFEKQRDFFKKVLAKQ